MVIICNVHSYIHRRSIGIYAPRLSNICRSPSPALSALDFMHLSTEIDREQQLPSFMHNQGIFSQLGVIQQDLSEDTMQGLDFGMHGSGWNTDLPSHIDELLSRAYMYWCGPWLYASNRSSFCFYLSQRRADVSRHSPTFSELDHRLITTRAGPEQPEFTN